jgi:hypothetical protein
MDVQARGMVQHSHWPQCRFSTRSGGELPARSAAISLIRFRTSPVKAGVFTFSVAWLSPCAILPITKTFRKVQDRDRSLDRSRLNLAPYCQSFRANSGSGIVAGSGNPTARNKTEHNRSAVVQR